MRKGWKQYSLGQICDVIAGQSPEGKNYNDRGEGLPFYQGKKDFGAKYICTPQKWTSQITKEAEAGDILMSVRAPVGPINFATEKICIGRGLAAIRPKNEIDRDFLFYGLLQKQPEIIGNEGAVFSSINKGQIESLQFPLPPLPEQKRIVAILDEAFEGIAVAVANAEKNLANARELFESYLNGIFTQKGEGLEMVKLSDLATDITDGDHSPPPKSPAGIPFITISNIHKETNKIDFSDTFTVPEEYFQNLKPNKRPRVGDVLYTVTGSFGIPVIVHEKRDFCFQRHIGLVRPRDDIDGFWLYYLLMSPSVFQQAKNGATGTAQKTVSLKVLRSILVPKIPLSEQKKAVAELDEISATTQCLKAIYQQKLTALTELKQSLLQKAFSGELMVELETAIKEEAVA